MPDKSAQGMEFESGVVANIIGDKAVVKMNLHPACDSCNAKILCFPDEEGKRQIVVNNPLSVSIGDRVLIAETGQFTLKLASLQFGIPLTGFVIGIIAGYFAEVNFFLAKELLAFVGGLIGLNGAGILSRWLAKRMALRGESFFSIVKVI